MINAEWLDDGTYTMSFSPPLEDEKPGPEIPPEIHNKRPIDAERCMQEMRVLCGDRR